MKTLDYIVNTVLNDIQDYTTNQRARYLQFAIQGYKEINFSALPNIKVEYLSIDDTHCVTLPDDYVGYTKIAVDVCGTLVTLSLNNNIPLYRHKDDCGNLTLEETLSACQSGDIESALPFGYYFPGYFDVRAGQYVGERFAHGGGFNRFGYFRVDTQKYPNRLQFKNVIPKGEIVLEYKSSGIDCSGSALVPEDAVAALVMYVHWRRMYFDRRVSAGEKQLAWQKYTEQYNILRHRKLKFTASEYLDMWYGTLSQGAKR